MVKHLTTFRHLWSRRCLLLTHLHVFDPADTEPSLIAQVQDPGQGATEGESYEHAHGSPHCPYELSPGYQVILLVDRLVGGVGPPSPGRFRGAKLEVEGEPLLQRWNQWVNLVLSGHKFFDLAQSGGLALVGVQEDFLQHFPVALLFLTGFIFQF